MTKSNRLDFATRCIHAGQEPDPTTGAVMMPIYATSTFVQQIPGVHKGFDYARTKNPTRMAFERCIADLEGGTHGLRVRVGARRDRDRAGMSRRRRARRRVRRPLRRHAAPVRARQAPHHGDRCHLCRSVGHCKAGSRDPAGDQTDLDRDADQSAAQADRPRTRRRDRAKAQHRRCRRQHLRQSLRAAAARASVSTWWCIRPPSISTVIPTWSAASRWSATTRSCASGSVFCRTRSAPSRGRSIRSWRCAA